MIPTKTLRERMTEALMRHVGNLVDDAGLNEANYEVILSLVVQDAINAIGDPCLIKTADSKEPTFTLRAQDKAAAEALECWIWNAERGRPEEKLDEAINCLNAFRAWTSRKRPD